MYTSLQLLDLCADVEDLLLVDDQSLPCSSCWLVMISSLWLAQQHSSWWNCDGLDGLDGLAVLPVLCVHPVLTLGDSADGFLGFGCEKFIYCLYPAPLVDSNACPGVLLPWSVCMWRACS